MIEVEFKPSTPSPIMQWLMNNAIAIAAFLLACYTLYLNRRRDVREQEKAEWEEEQRRRAEADREEARQRAAAGKLDVTVDYQHDCGDTVFAMITVRNSRITDDEINSVILESYPTTEWKVLVPDKASGVPIQSSAWPQWNHGFPVLVPAGRTVTFWISGYAKMGIKEHEAQDWIGKVFVFNIRARSGDVKLDTKLRKKP